MNASQVADCDFQGPGAFSGFTRCWMGMRLWSDLLVHPQTPPGPVGPFWLLRFCPPRRHVQL